MKLAAENAAKAKAKKEMVRNDPIKKILKVNQKSFKFQKTMNDTLLKILERYELDKPILMSDKLDIIWDKSTKVNKDET